MRPLLQEDLMPLAVEFPSFVPRPSLLFLLITKKDEIPHPFSRERTPDFGKR